jgi:hypothetical protein
LKRVAAESIGKVDIFDLLMYIANGRSEKGEIWNRIQQILKRSQIGELEADTGRLLELYGLFNPRRYTGSAYLTVKLFLIFREIRIQFKDIGAYQYNPAICCIPDFHVREALRETGLLPESDNSIRSLIEASEIVANNFCSEEYDLYDLPLFFAHKENCLKTIIEQSDIAETVLQNQTVKCPTCGSPIVWRTSKTGETYRGCTNYDGGCRWNDRSY